MSWLWGGSSSDPAPTPKFPSTPGTNPPPPSTTLSALGIGVASDPRAQKAATEFAQDEGVQNAASNFTRDKRVQQAFLTSVGLPGGAQQFRDDASGRPTRAKETSKTTTTNRTKSNDVEGRTRTTKRKPSVAALAAMAAFEDSETKRREKIGSGGGGGGENLKALEHSSGMTVIRREKGFGNLSEKNLKRDSLPPPPPPPPPLYLCDPCPHGNVPVSFKQQFQLYTFVGMMEEEREKEEREKEARERESGGERGRENSSSPPLLVDLLNKLYQDHTGEGPGHEGGEDVLSEFKKEEMTLSRLLHQYMNVEEPERNTLYYHDEIDCDKDGRGKLAELMMRQIKCQAMEDDKRRGWV